MWSPFGPFYSVKYLYFGKKLPIWTAHHTFRESRHPDVMKNPFYVLSPKGISSWTKTNKCIFNFQQFETELSFGDNILNGKITLCEADKNKQSLNNVLEFNGKARPKAKADEKKRYILMIV